MRLDTSDQSLHSQSGRSFSTTGRDDEIGAPPFFGVRHLLTQDCIEFCRCHARARHHPLALDPGRGRDDNRGIAPLPAPFFKQKRNVEDNDAVADVTFQEMHLFRTDKRMHQRFKTRQRDGIAENGIAQFLPVEAIRSCRSGKQPLDHLQRTAARSLKGAHGSVGVEYGYAMAAEHCRHRRLSHADRSRQAKHDHDINRARNSASCWRGAGLP